MSETLTYEKLLDAVQGAAVALRSILRLQPVDGPGGKIFPPTYSVGEGSSYAYEQRFNPSGEETKTVLIDSVASQANRAEMALLQAWDGGQIKFPVPYIDFSDCEVVPEYDRLTVLETPHRLADAIFRDCDLDGKSFRLTEVADEIFKSTPSCATALYKHAPTAVLFGQWDSTGHAGGLGAKFQRAYVSEIVGFEAVPGVKVSSRIDSLGIIKDGATIYEHKDPMKVWTANKSEAEPVKGKKGEYKMLKPSEINHGNIVPSIDEAVGGVTISEARQTTVISLAGLRKLRFPGDDELAARTALASLGVAAMAFAVESDYDLRSRCLLVPVEPQEVELVSRDGSPSEKVVINGEVAAKILKQASDAAKKAGIGWSTDEMVLNPSEKLIALLKDSRKITDVTDFE